MARVNGTVQVDGQRWALPILEGQLRVEHRRPPGVEVVLAAHYRPPGGRAGDVLTRS